MSDGRPLHPVTVDMLTDDQIRIARTAARSEIEALIGLIHDCGDELAFGCRLDVVRMSNETSAERRRRICDAINTHNEAPWR